MEEIEMLYLLCFFFLVVHLFYLIYYNKTIYLNIIITMKINLISLFTHIFSWKKMEIHRELQTKKQMKTVHKPNSWHWPLCGAHILNERLSSFKSMRLVVLLLLLSFYPLHTINSCQLDIVGTKNDKTNREGKIELLSKLFHKQNPRWCGRFFLFLPILWLNKVIALSFIHCLHFWLSFRWKEEQQNWSAKVVLVINNNQLV